ncbi:MAG: hypothetical protein Q4E07_06705 [Eubacteriales bacterium]|nr:hypothetical protein [Eubacteriales bacterium]
MEFSKDIFLAFIEEDNEQHSLFHIRPLLSAEGPMPENIISSFNDNGFLRIAPDKKEQFTFKERMRSLGNLCIIDLTEVEDDAGKIRPNRNYSPRHNELHQFIIYSDVVKQLPEDLVYEVIAGEEGKPIENCTTPMCFLRSGGRIEGPYRASDGSPADNISAIAPDSPHIFAISLPNGQEKLFFWASSLSAPDNDSEEERETSLIPESSLVEKGDLTKRYKRSHASRLTAAVGRRNRENMLSGKGIEELLSPMEAFKTSVPKVFADEAKGEEAFNYLMDMPKAQDLINRMLNINPGENPLITAFNSQIDALEAERLKISMQLDKLKKDKQELFNTALEEKSAMVDSKLAGKTEELNKLSSEIQALKGESKKLLDTRDDFISRFNKPVLAKPQGEEKPVSTAVQRLREHLQSAGFVISINQAWFLLTMLLFEDQVQLCAPTLADSRLMAKTVACSLGASFVSFLKDDENLPYLHGGSGIAFALVSRGGRDMSPFTRLIAADKIQPFGKAYPYAVWPCFSLDAAETKFGYTQLLPCENAFDAELLRQTLVENRLNSMPQEAKDIINGIVKSVSGIPMSLVNRMVNTVLISSPHLSGGIASSLDFGIAAYILPYAHFNGLTLNIPKQILLNLPQTAKLL